MPQALTVFVLTLRTERAGNLNVSCKGVLVVAIGFA
jgi:hypothetical protein